MKARVLLYFGSFNPVHRGHIALAEYAISDGFADQVAASVQRLEAVAKNTGAIECIPMNDPQLAADIWRVRGCFVKAVEAVSQADKKFPFLRFRKEKNFPSVS